MDYNTASTISQMLTHSWCSESCVPSPLSDTSTTSSLSPVYVVAASMTARGGWKALRMQRVLRHVTSSLQCLVLRIKSALDRLHALPSLELVKTQLLKQQQEVASKSSCAHVPEALAHHRVIVGCCIKRRRYISLLTGALGFFLR